MLQVWKKHCYCQCNQCACVSNYTYAGFSRSGCYWKN